MPKAGSKRTVPAHAQSGHTQTCSAKISLPPLSLSLRPVLPPYLAERVRVGRRVVVEGAVECLSRLDGVALAVGVVLGGPLEILGVHAPTAAEEPAAVRVHGLDQVQVVRRIHAEPGGEEGGRLLRGRADRPAHLQGRGGITAWCARVRRAREGLRHGARAVCEGETSEASEVDNPAEHHMRCIL